MKDIIAEAFKESLLEAFAGIFENEAEAENTKEEI